MFQIRHAMAEALFNLRGLVGSWSKAGSGWTATGCGLSRTQRGSASKKTALASERDRPDVVRKRLRWKAHPGVLTFGDLFS